MSFSTSRPSADNLPEPVALMAAVMTSYSRDWCLCGGWAVDAWLGSVTRDHKDVDIAVFEDDLAVLSKHLDGWRLVAHDEREPDAMEPWAGRELVLPAHIHAYRDDGFDLDIQVCRRADGRWLVNTSSLGLPTLAPEVLLYYKALDLRPEDEADFAALAPHLKPPQIAWLRGAIFQVRHDHPWLLRDELRTVR